MIRTYRYLLVGMDGVTDVTVILIATRRCGVIRLIPAGGWPATRLRHLRSYSDVDGAYLSPVSAPRPGQYQLVWSTIDGGGGTSNGWLYILTDTIGRPDVDWSCGGKYELLGGFWQGWPRVPGVLVSPLSRFRF